MGTLTNNEDLHFWLRQNQSSEKEIQHFWESITRDPLIYIIDHPGLNVFSFMVNSIVFKGLLDSV